MKRHNDIVRRLKAGQSIRDIAAITGKGISTVQRVKALVSYDPVLRGFAERPVPTTSCGDLPPEKS